MKKWLVAVLFGITLILGACGGGDDNNNNNVNNGDTNGASEADAGQDVFKDNCMTCHGGIGDGGGAGPDLAGVGDDHSADDIDDIIQNGTGSMQPQPQVSDDDREVLIDWLMDQ